MKILLVLSAFTAVLYAAVSNKFHKSEDGSIFLLEGEQKFTWYEAWQQCALQDMSLVTIDSIRKHQQIDKLIRKVFPVCPSLWLAANDFVADKKFTWITTGQPLNFTNWGDNQPNADINEHCVLIFEKTWEWHDVKCLAKRGYICELKSHCKGKEQEEKVLSESKKNFENQTPIMSKYHSIIFNRR